ncbi:MAG: family 43 glycosylhydrolase [Actinobacteria bacterium]|nr:family 43 glycosylhydrolase [Actinomycetota bacterium]
MALQRSPRPSRRWLRILTLLPLSVVLAVPAVSATSAAGATTTAAQATTANTLTYTNPLKPKIIGDGVVGSCADPTVFRSHTVGDRAWYMFCTSDPLNDAEAAAGVFHRIPMNRSVDLVHWTYVGDAFQSQPAIADPGAHLWAPEVVYSSTFHKYYLLFTVTDVTDATPGAEPGCHGDSAIAVATSTLPSGPWTASTTPVVAPRSNGGTCNFFATIDPDVLASADYVVGATSYIYYGSYYGGIQARPVTLTLTGAVAPGPATQITIPNRYEGSEVVYRNGYYYLFASATNCCNGQLTGYTVFAGRSANPLGPFVDKQGVSLLAGRVGGTPVLSMNGNRWVGPGHNTVFRDFAGQWWTIYHAVNRFDPYFATQPGFTKRPPMMDPIDWIDGWPTVRGGKWVSDQPMPAPAAQPGETTAYRTEHVRPDLLGTLIPGASDGFNGYALSSKWTWVRPPDPATYGVAGGTFRFDTQAADLYVDSNNASVLTEAAPTGDYVVTTKVHLNLPPEGCCYNYVQAGLVIYGDDDNFIKLAHVSIWETRQTEFAKEMAPVPAGWARYGNSVVGPPGDWTWLRVVKRSVSAASHGGDTELYTAYTSNDGTHWVRGGTWTHHLGSTARIGLVSMGGSGFTANFDYVRVNHLANP